MDMWLYSDRKGKNTEIRDLFQLEPVSMVINKSRQRWIGHTECKDDI